MAPVRTDHVWKMNGTVNSGKNCKARSENTNKGNLYRYVYTYMHACNNNWNMWTHLAIHLNMDMGVYHVCISTYICIYTCATMYMRATMFQKWYRKILTWKHVYAHRCMYVLHWYMCVHDPSTHTFGRSTYGSHMNIMYVYVYIYVHICLYVYTLWCSTLATVKEWTVEQWTVTSGTQWRVGVFCLETMFE